MPDIDIDLLDRDKALGIIRHVPASIYKESKITKHNTGIYAQDIPIDPVTKFASLDLDKDDPVNCLSNININENTGFDKHAVPIE